MVHIKLTVSGREVTIDLSKMTMREWREAREKSDAENDALIGKCTGMTADEIAGLNYVDCTQLYREFLKAAQNPLADPN